MNYQILVSFTMHWCGNCRKLGNNVSPEARIAAFKQGYRGERFNPSVLSAVESSKSKSKLQLLVSSAALGSVAIYLLGRPTLASLFSDKLEARLWDPQDIIKQNLLAMGASLGALLLLSRYFPTP